MKKYLKIETLTEREVPPELDLRILAASRLQQNSVIRHRKKLRLIFSSSAAAAALFIAIGVSMMPEKQNFKQISREEYARLADMTDWDSLEQESFNLSNELSFGSSQVTELADSRLNIGG